jgi:hypothetical protein
MAGKATSSAKTSCANLVDSCVRCCGSGVISSVEGVGVELVQHLTDGVARQQQRRNVFAEPYKMMLNQFCPIFKRIRIALET